ncbi:MAG: hypothetical protein LBI35_07410 [Burkholderiales bacterium]|jgi:hypothetical protein|nr:hypothetical protein [Burkholderiales bacterium]
MNRVLIALVIVSCVALNGCTGAKSQYASGERVKGAKLIRNNPDAHDRPILMLRSELPKEVKIEIIGEVRSNNKFYGGLGRVMEDMAYKARLAGADAVININIKWRPTVLAAVAGSAAGVAVKIIDNGGVDLNALPDAKWRMGKRIPAKEGEAAPEEQDSGEDDWPASSKENEE